MRRVAVFLAEGFEEIEAVVPIDILRRGGVEVVVAGVGTDVVTGSHGITIDTDAVVEEIDINDFDGLILPGGLPGANNLAESEGVNKLLNSARDEGKLIAAICASPALVLSPLGILKNKKLPGIREQNSSILILSATLMKRLFQTVILLPVKALARLSILR